ncbi:hypothetical protein EJP67_27900 [Variovorax guangxiensis]|uniref:TolC family protein n=1 Tax=Variovorax guangxiensis TaxID=1775474 RepID=A0A3S0XVV1_9BURK|nr:hypothetical protein [Variovorax guangxiensis]RUR70887.1 hypothetical protein EJP67_27900 [Variovorax guangxiensis]
MRSRTLLAAVCGALAIACASTSIAMVHRTSQQLAAHMLAGHATQGAPTAPRAQADTRSWWSAFEDPALDRLMAASRDGNAEAGIAAAYIALKVKTLESSYLENTRAAIARQTMLIKGAKLPYDDFAKQLAQRQSGAQATIEKLQAQRASYIAYLAKQCHMSEAALGEMLADALQDKSLPRFAAEVPRELPMTVLANRNDINLAAALYDADPAAMPAGTIDAAATDEAQDIEVPGKPLYARAVAQAREQVAEALRRLQMQSDIANTAYARVVNARAGFEVSKRRRDRGEISEVQLMEDFQGLLLDLHVLAAANGELALAWVVLMGSIGSGASIDTIADPRSAKTERTGQNEQLPFLHKVSRKLRNP